ncbi:MAG: hypothetical protein ACP5I8_08495 [Phycisphaerae bacterium]
MFTTEAVEVIGGCFCGQLIVAQARASVVLRCRRIPLWFKKPRIALCRRGVNKGRPYFEQDANWNTAAVVGFNATSGTWNVVQRYTYSPYGTISILNADWSTPPAGTQPMVNNLYLGMTLDSVTGLYYERNRNYSPSLGIWISQDSRLHQRCEYLSVCDEYSGGETGFNGDGCSRDSESNRWGSPDTRSTRE